MYHHRTTFGSVELAFTDRFGGVSAPPYDELNLGLSTPDDPGAVAENHRRLLADFAPDAELADMYQVHGNAVTVVEGPVGSDRPRCDALVTTRPEVVLLVRVADCAPVLLADPAAGVVAAVHSGRPGLAARVVPATVDRMRDLGASAITAWLGPHVCGGCYEVPQEMQDDVAELEPASRATTTWGTPALDIGAGVRDQLRRARVEVVDVSACTRESATLFSHRRDGVAAGRSAGVIRIRR